jgi:hypothetical protein
MPIKDLENLPLLNNTINNTYSINQDLLHSQQIQQEDTTPFNTVSHTLNDDQLLYTSIINSGARLRSKDTTSKKRLQVMDLHRRMAHASCDRRMCKAIQTQITQQLVGNLLNYFPPIYNQLSIQKHV